MLRKALISLLCVSVLLAVLGSCGNPTNSVFQDAGTDRENPADEDNTDGEDDEDEALKVKAQAMP